jgi:hypothetical protein
VQPIPDPNILAFQGVKRGAERGSSSPLQNLLAGIGTEKTRGASAITPADWSLQRLSLHSKPK